MLVIILVGKEVQGDKQQHNLDQVPGLVEDSRACLDPMLSEPSEGAQNLG